MSTLVKDKEVIIINEYTKEDIKEMICEYNGELVIFDFCLAKIFHYSLKHINQNVKNNNHKYQEDDIHMIGLEEAKEIIKSSMTIHGVSLTENDFSLTENLLSTTYEIKLNSRYTPKVFTKNGVKLLTESIKKNDVTECLSIILEAFDEVEKDNLITEKVAYNQGYFNVYDKIYKMRGLQVMLDFDLAPLYGYEVKSFNRQVERNNERFPDGYRFQLSKEEFENLWCQIGTANRSSMARTLPYAFSERGILMLSSVLKSQRAIEQSLYIVEQFFYMRTMINTNQYLFQQTKPNDLALETTVQLLQEEYNNFKNNINDRVDKVDENAQKQGEILENILQLLEGDEPKKEMTFYKNKLFEADLTYKEIYSQAEHSIYIIDNYISIKTLSHLSCKKEGVNVVLFSDNLGGKDKLRKVEFDDFSSQYPTLSLKHNYISHDRYIVIDYKTDNEKIYHSGASIKDAGKKICTIMQINDIHMMHEMIDELLLHDDYEL